MSINYDNKHCLICCLLLAFALVFFGACKDMITQLDKTRYENAILSYLQDKYQEGFTIESIYQEFSGDTGSVVRATCKAVDNSETFTVHCYLDKTITPHTMLVNGQAHSVEDTYTEVLCQKRLMQSLAGNLGDHCVVKCNVDFYNRQPTSDEYAQGIEACMKNAELCAYIKVYIMSDGNTDAQAVYSAAEKLVEQYAPDTGYIYFAVPKTFDAVYAGQVYAEHYNDFGNFLTQNDYAATIWFTLYESEAGLQSRQLVKG